MFLLYCVFDAITFKIWLKSFCAQFKFSLTMFDVFSALIDPLKNWFMISYE